ncbi:MAG: hypothetical protein M1115_10750 [Actinobacteria bacterium]|nr:hypothetical protein [Actinomycetota bacterium]
MRQVSPQRLLQVLLGLVWLVDGVLQLQPFMFGRGFVTGVLLPSAQGNPTPVADSITAMAHFLEPHVAAWNALFAVIQLAIGIGLLIRRTVRPALAVSFAWSLAVWWLGEGLGGLLTGSASPLSGAPGAVSLYVLIGVLAWPRRGQRKDVGATLSDALLGEAGARIAWALVWVGSAALLVQPVNLAPGALHNTLEAAKAGQPGWYAGLLSWAANALGYHGTLLTLGLAAEMLLVGAGIALGWKVPSLLGIAMLLAVLIWVFPEGLGGVLTGQGTDPNTGPLLALWAFAWWNWSRFEPEVLEMVVTAAVVEPA